MMMPVRSLETSDGSSPEPHGAAVDHTFGIERRRALDLRAEPKLRVFLGPRDAGLGLVETRQHFLSVVSDR